MKQLDEQAAAMADLVKELERDQDLALEDARQAKKAAEEAAVARARQLRREKIQDALRGVDVCWYDRPKVSVWDFLQLCLRHILSWSAFIALVAVVVGLPSYDMAGVYLAIKALSWWLTRGLLFSLAFAGLFDLVEVHRGNSSRWWVIKHEYTFGGATADWVEDVPTADTRTDQSSVGEGKHRDPMLCWMKHRRYVYIGGFHLWRKTTTILVSGELLMQLLDGSNMRLSSTSETVCGRLEDVASRSQSVILDKIVALGWENAPACATQAKVNTATIAYGFWESMRERLKHVPFHRSPSRS